MGTHVRERESHVREFDMVEAGALRRSVGAAIEALVDLLDSLDADPDLEPDSEPTLGWREGRRNQAACPTVADEAETGAWLEGPNQQHIGRLGRQHEDEEATALERHGTGFVATGLDDSEDSDPGGGDILDEPHDCTGIFDDMIGDPGEFRDELAFQRWGRTPDAYVSKRTRPPGRRS